MELIYLETAIHRYEVYLSFNSCKGSQDEDCKKLALIRIGKVSEIKMDQMLSQIQS